MSETKQSSCELSIAAIRCLLLDEIEQAKSGHPGMALDVAPAFYALYHDHLIADPAHPLWENRDRFVLSSGHNSALLYAVLHLAGYDVKMDDLKQFRQLHSKTPGHPEWGVTAGVDATAGPLGQGIGQAVGMAMAEEKIRAAYPDISSFYGHYTFCLCGDGCLEEGISQEAISLAGHLQLNKLILIYDENTSTLDGPTSNSLTENEDLRFKAAGWNVIDIDDGNDVSAISNAIQEAKKSSSRPTMIHLHTIIGYGSENAGSHKTHGAPLSAEDTARTKAFYHYDYPAFTVPEEVYADFRDSFGNRGKEAFERYAAQKAKWEAKHPDAAKDFQRALQRDWRDYAVKTPEIKTEESTRNASGRFLISLASSVPFTFGGSADVASSVKTILPDNTGFDAEHRNAKNIDFGIREFAMAAIQNGMLLHGGVIPYVGSFLVFSDYMKSAIRMACLEHLPAIYLFSHDSIAVGEDGPTHEPIEQLAALRTMPFIDVIRPCDDRETFAAWKLALDSHDHPTAIILTRQNLPLAAHSSEEGVKEGAYVISPAKKKAVYQLIASGSEVALAMEVQQRLLSERIDVEVVSMPSTERFLSLPLEKQESILSLPRSKRIAIEMLAGDTWYRFADHVISLDRYGESAPAAKVIEDLGFTPEQVTSKVLVWMKSNH